VAGGRGERADQAEFGDPEATGGDGQRGEQPDQREGRQGRLPGQLRLGQADAAQAGQQHEPQDEVAGHCGGSDPPAAGREQDAGPVAEAGQRSGGAGRRWPASEPADKGRRTLQRLACPGGEGLAAQEQAEPADPGGEQGHAHGRPSDQGGVGSAGRGHHEHGQDGQAQQDKDVPDPGDQRVQDVVGGAQAPAGEHRPADAHGEGAAGRQSTGHRVGAKVDRRRLPQPQRGQYRSDGDPVRDHACDGRGGDQQDVRPGHRLHAGPHAAVGRDMRDGEPERHRDQGD
jgi:hypothetical protein